MLFRSMLKVVKTYVDIVRDICYCKLANLLTKRILLVIR